MKFNTILLLFLSLSELGFGGMQFGDIPVHENGRIKPLDTFSRNQLLSMYEKRSLKSDALPGNNNIQKMEAVDWLLQLITHPDNNDAFHVFNIRNPQVVGSLGLEWRKSHVYNRMEVLSGIQHQISYIADIQGKSEEQLTEFDKQMLRVYGNIIRFQELSYSFTCLLPLISIENEEIAEKLQVEKGEKLSYFQIVRNIDAINEPLKALLNKEEPQWNAEEREVKRIVTLLNDIGQDNFAVSIKIIPPENADDEAVWLSPWEIMDSRELGEKQEKLLITLEEYIQAYLQNDESQMVSTLAKYESLLKSDFGQLLSVKNLKTESWMNHTKLFYKSMAFYLLSFILLSLSWVFKPELLRKMSFVSLLTGVGFHAYAIYLRIIVMQRPPVSTLYESVIFVSLIGVLSAAILEYSRKDGIGVFAGSVCGIVLHFVGFGYANDGDTLGMLVAVLNSNFWLATHVTTITIGYGTSLFAGLLGHIYLIQAIRSPEDKANLKTINSNMFGATLFALFFTLFGTILGGIWADQSWGRFWGWDPKENGALLIVMWQIMMLHMRITGLVKPMGFALGLVLNNIVVILAWFGVNLLSVGLHSYGFASGIAINIAIFIAVEVISGLGTYFWASNRRLKLKP